MGGSFFLDVQVLRMQGTRTKGHSLYTRWWGLVLSRRHARVSSVYIVFDRKCAWVVPSLLVFLRVLGGAGSSSYAPEPLG